MSEPAVTLIAEGKVLSDRDEALLAREQLHAGLVDAVETGVDRRGFFKKSSQGRNG